MRHEKACITFLSFGSWIYSRIFIDGRKRTHMSTTQHVALHAHAHVFVTLWRYAHHPYAVCAWIVHECFCMREPATCSIFTLFFLILLITSLLPCLWRRVGVTSWCEQSLLLFVLWIHPNVHVHIHTRATRCKSWYVTYAGARLWLQSTFTHAHGIYCVFWRHAAFQRLYIGASLQRVCCMSYIDGSSMMGFLSTSVLMCAAPRIIPLQAQVL